MACRLTDNPYADGFPHVVALDREQERYIRPNDFQPIRTWLASDRATGQHVFFWDANDTPHYAFSDANTAFAFKMEFG